MLIVVFEVFLCSMNARVVCEETAIEFIHFGYFLALLDQYNVFIVVRYLVGLIYFLKNVYNLKD